MSTIRRRNPVVIGPPHNTAGPNRWIPKIRVLGRAVGRVGLSAGLILSIHPPHGIAAVSTHLVQNVRPIVPLVKRSNGYVLRIARLNRIDVTTNRVASRLVVIGPQIKRNLGNVLRIKPPFPVVVPLGRVPRNRYLGTTYHRDGYVKKSQHSHTVVIPVTSVRPKIVKLVPDLSRRHRRGQWQQVRHGIINQPLIVSSGNALIANVNTTATWQTHFTGHGWNSPQDQINAGYPYFMQPAELTGSYQEVFDFGSIISNIIVIVNWNFADIVAGVTTATTTLETSTDAITWSAPAVGTSLFSASLRYVRLTMNFVGATDKALAIYSNLQCLLNVHREQDGGQANVFAADVGGTVIAFNKTFKALDALAITPINTVRQTAIYDFAFPVNPTTFKVLLFDAAGARVNGLITWVARGIL